MYNKIWENIHSSGPYNIMSSIKSILNLMNDDLQYQYDICEKNYCLAWLNVFLYLQY